MRALPQFERAMNGSLQGPNLDIYVTESNSSFLARDVVTKFRERVDEVRAVYPLSLAIFNVCGKIL